MGGRVPEEAVGAGGAEPKQRSADEILAHDRFSEARRAHIDAFIGVFGKERFRIRLFADSGALMLSSLLVGLHAIHDDAVRETWATPTLVRRLVARHRHVSPRKLDHLIARFRQTGYVTSVPIPGDRRLRVMRPTDRLLQHDRAYVAALYRPLDVLYPDAAYGSVVAQSPNAHLAIRREGMFGLSQVSLFRARSPDIMWYLARHAGYLALLLVARAMLPNAPAIEQAASYTAVATRLGVSRTHVRRLFEVATAAGHVTLHAQGGRVERVQPRLWHALDRFIAELAARHDAIAKLAFARSPPVTSGRHCEVLSSDLREACASGCDAVRQTTATAP
jgi:hypothetical protein